MDQSNIDEHLSELRQFIHRNARELIRARQRVYALEADQELRRRGRQPRMPIEFPAQFGEDLLAWDLLGGQMEGFFIEAGAFDGYHYSVTYAFEAVGWNGLLVEPLAGPAQLCTRRRPNSRVVHAALSNRGAAGETEFMMVHDAYGGMLSHVPGSGVLEPDSDANMQSIRVPLTNLNTLLADHRGAIDLVVLDVEGHEPQVLDGFDLARYRPRLLFIESSQIEHVREVMAPFPYLYGGNSVMNHLFVRNDELEIMERIRWIRLGSE